MNYKKNDRVVIKPWKQLEMEGEIDIDSSINCDGVSFVDSMESGLKGTDRVVKIESVRSNSYKAVFPDGKEWAIGDAMILGYAFEFGEEIEVSNNGRNWEPAKFSAYAPGHLRPVKTTQPPAGHKYARPIRKPDIKITVEVNGKKSKLSDISEETLLKIRNTNG